MSDKSVEFVPLKGFENYYEIMNEYPFTIRRTSDKYVLSEFTNIDGYTMVNLHRDQYRKHRLIALQFIPNDDPEHKTDVDHRNKHRNDNHLENLRWVTPSKNCENKTSHYGVTYEFIDDIPDDAVLVDFYDTRNGHHEFDKDHYYYKNIDGNHVFYGKIDDNIYKILHINTIKGETQFVCLRDTNNVKVSVYIKRFLYQHDL